MIRRLAQLVPGPPEPAMLPARPDSSRRLHRKEPINGLHRCTVTGDVGCSVGRAFLKQPRGRYSQWPCQRHGHHRSGHEIQRRDCRADQRVRLAGKTFDAARGVLRNRILPIGLNAIVATVYKGPSWLDNKECIVLDYSETSLVARWIRDEIRLIDSGFYLGRVYWDKKPLIHFSLEFQGQ